MSEGEGAEESEREQEKLGLRGGRVTVGVEGDQVFSFEI